MRERSTYRAAVISDGATFWPDGTSTAGTAPSLQRLLWGAGLHLTERACVVFDRIDPRTFGTPPDGWRVNGDGPWRTYSNGERDVTVGFRAAMVPHRHYGVLFDETTDPGVLALLLDRYHRAVGLPWRGTPATTAHHAIRLSWANGHRTPLWHEARPERAHGAGFLHWSRIPTELEREWGYAHRFDANGAYLGAASSAALPWGPLVRAAAERGFDPAVGGVWRIRPGAELLAWQDDPMRPPLFGNRQPNRPAFDAAGCTWVTTPYARLLAELGTFDVVESLTAERTGRVLRTWAEQTRDALTLARAETGPQVRTVLTRAVGRTYKDAIGGFQRDKMPITRHVWGWTVIDQWRATLLRAAIRVHDSQGVWPLAVATDSLTYADCAPTPAPSPDRRFLGLLEALNVASCEIGCGCTPAGGGRLGTWKHEATHELAGWSA